MKFDSIIESVLNENEHTASIGTVLYHLMGDLRDKTKKMTREDILKRLELFLKEYNDAINKVEQPHRKELSLD